MSDIFLKPFHSHGVERRVIPSISRGWLRLCRVSLLLAFGASFAAGLEAEPFRSVQAPSFEMGSPVKPKEPEKPAFDELVYRDGDRVRGHLLRREGDSLVFRSERFGVLRVPAAEAEVILAKPPTPAVAAAVAKDKKADVAVERAPFSPLGLARSLKDFFGSWHGRFALSAEMLQDSSTHESDAVEGHLQRKWTADEVELNGHYDFASVDNVTSTDMLKADGVWRHDLPHKLFGVYRPTLEWNRAFFRDNVPADYVLLQEEVGLGINLLGTDTRKVRAGVSENVFDTWIVPTQSHLSQNVESSFIEVEAKLPWRIVLSDRGVYYYSINNNTEGWENSFEINKKLTETLTIGVRHEIRHNNPDVRSADYRRLRMLFGFDF